MGFGAIENFGLDAVYFRVFVRFFRGREGAVPAYLLLGTANGFGGNFLLFSNANLLFSNANLLRFLFFFRSNLTITFRVDGDPRFLLKAPFVRPIVNPLLLFNFWCVSNFAPDCFECFSKTGAKNIH